MKTIFQFLFALCGAGLMCVPNGGAQSTNYMVLHNLTGNDGDGATPYARLAEGSDGVLYGTTQTGGSAGYGTVTDTIGNPRNLQLGLRLDF